MDFPIDVARKLRDKYDLFYQTANTMENIAEQLINKGFTVDESFDLIDRIFEEIYSREREEV